MLFEGLVSQALERLLGLGEGGVPAFVSGHFLKDDRRELVLLPVGETRRGFERLVQRLSHGRGSRLDGAKLSRGNSTGARWHLRRTSTGCGSSPPRGVPSPARSAPRRRPAQPHPRPQPHLSAPFLTASPWQRRMARGQRAIAVPPPAFAPIKRAAPVSGWGVRRGGRIPPTRVAPMKIALLHSLLGARWTDRLRRARRRLLDLQAER